MTRIQSKLLHAGLIASMALALNAGAYAQPAAQPAAKPKPKPAAPLYAGSDVGKAVDGMTSACSTAREQHVRIQALATERSAAQASLSKAQQALAKHRKTLVSTKQRMQAEARRGGAATDALINSARTHYKSTLDQAKAVEDETKRLRAVEEELVKLVEVAEDAAKACETHEATLRAAANEARKQVANARVNAGKARTLAKLSPDSTRAQSREREARQLADLQASTDEARAELEAIEAAALQAKGAVVEDSAQKNTAPAASAKRPR
jgi:hypothetical protein